MPELFNLQTAAFESAEIVSPMQLREIDDFVDHWHPPMDRIVQELKRQGIDTHAERTARNVEDSHWKWPEKYVDRAGILEWNSFALRCADQTQGLMYVNMLRRCKLSVQAKQHLVYVDLLATAPWNRSRLTATPLYRGVGLILFTEAVILSMEEGFGGRVGLHSLTGADEFYGKRLLMQDLGPDPAYHNLHYFEFIAAQADAFLT